MALTEIPFILLSLAILAAIVWGVFLALRSRAWGWALVQLLVPVIGTAVYLLVVVRERDDG